MRLWVRFVRLAATSALPFFFLSFAFGGAGRGILLVVTGLLITACGGVLLFDVGGAGGYFASRRGMVRSRAVIVNNGLPWLLAGLVFVLVGALESIGIFMFGGS